MYRQLETANEDALVEPVGQHELHTFDTARSCDQLFPFIDPGELLAPPMLAVPDGGAHDRRLQPRQGALEKVVVARARSPADRSEEHTSELQSLMRISYAVFCLKKKTQKDLTY